ncbi:MAG: SDR family oxidoreductase [Chloroflexi bacterium]|nr:SDR family oxidoreductase [Chloroflexota bacterium]
MDRSIASLDGRTAIVTGGANGIGKGIAMGLAAFGANVVIADKDGPAAQQTAAEIAKKGVRTLSYAVDVREFDQVKAMTKATLDTFGKINILVNNVGGTFKSNFLDVAEKGWDALIRINLKSALYCTKSVADEMIRLKTGGAIIQVTSIEAWRAAPGYAVYSACKAALENFTWTMALELAQHNIRVNSIAPDVILTPGVPLGTKPEDRERYNRTIPLKRVGTIEDCAGAAVYLASDMSSFVTGQTIHVDGGNYASKGWIRDPSGTWVTGH